MGRGTKGLPIAGKIILKKALSLLTGPNALTRKGLCSQSIMV